MFFYQKTFKIEEIQKGTPYVFYQKTLKIEEIQKDNPYGLRKSNSNGPTSI